MSGLKLAKSTPNQPGGASEAIAGASAPPPIPGAKGESQAKSTSETQTPYSIPLPGKNKPGAAQASTVSTTPASPPPPPPPPPPPQLSSSPASVRHAALMEEKGKGNGSRIILIVVSILFLGGIGTGIFLFIRNSDFFNGPPESVHWPSIELSGMAGVRTAEETGSAILNGSLISVDQRIEGATLVAIEDDGVVLEYRQEQKFIRIGETTR